MKIQTIKNKKQYEIYLKRMKKIFGASKGSKESYELDLLALVIEDYESKKYPIPLSDPIEAIKFFMEQNNLVVTDLAKTIKNKKGASEILNKKRKLSINHIRAISFEWKISANILIRDYQLV